MCTQAIHSQTPSYRCGLCDKSYRQKNVFLHHLRNRHKVSTDVLDRRRCHIKNNAGGGGAGGGGLMEAIPAAPLPPPTLSSVCLPPLSPPEPPPGEAAPPVMLRISDRGGGGSQALLQHHSPSSSPLWQCPFCAFESAHDPDVCRSHLLQHVGEPADCPLCPRQMASPQELAAHLRDFHESAGLSPIMGGGGGAPAMGGSSWLLQLVTVLNGQNTGETDLSRPSLLCFVCSAPTFTVNAMYSPACL